VEVGLWGATATGEANAALGTGIGGGAQTDCDWLGSDGELVRTSISDLELSIGDGVEAE